MEPSYVAVVPAPLARGRIPLLARNVGRALRARGLRFGSVRREGGVILVDADDPVLASSAAAMLFGTEEVSIVRRTGGSLEEVAAGIAEVGGRLLLKDERFLARVEGATSGFLPADAEAAATSRLVGGGARAGTPRAHDRVLRARVEGARAYVSIFTDPGLGGAPSGSRSGACACAIHDDVSAISCYEAARQGYEVAISVCYSRGRELARLARHACRIMQRTADGGVITFHRIQSSGRPARAGAAARVAARAGQKYAALPFLPGAFPDEFSDGVRKEMLEGGATPLDTLGSGDAMPRAARELGIKESASWWARARGGARGGAAGPGRAVRVRVGPNMLHEVLDSLGGGARRRG
ncbi:MAG: hypothetical protein MPI95_03000 [Nitrosopumilus sp.]|nr:hypothetical protein [Nitrosopumilus sp.]MDA7942558.1 hypothetical protein [Nitrosopumilus sp.]MDA7952556.1 hypothetical protein [Nitrosopumilus sp.]MDA7958044.1 hypothetical protein [Nitrosopumilus sp.]